MMGQYWWYLGLAVTVIAALAFVATVTMAVDGSVVWRHFSFKRIVDYDAVAFEFPPYLRLFSNKCRGYLSRAL